MHSPRNFSAGRALRPSVPASMSTWAKRSATWGTDAGGRLLPDRVEAPPGRSRRPEYAGAGPSADGARRGGGRIVQACPGGPARFGRGARITSAWSSGSWAELEEAIAASARRRARPACLPRAHEPRPGAAPTRSGRRGAWSLSGRRSACGRGWRSCTTILPTARQSRPRCRSYVRRAGRPRLDPDLAHPAAHTVPSPQSRSAAWRSGPGSPQSLPGRLLADAGAVRRRGAGVPRGAAARPRAGGDASPDRHQAEARGAARGRASLVQAGGRARARRAVVLGATGASCTASATSPARRFRAGSGCWPCRDRKSRHAHQPGLGAAGGGAAARGQAALPGRRAARARFGAAVLHLGGIDAEAGRMDAAEAAFRAALRLQPSAVQPHARLATLLRDKLPDADRAALRRLADNRLGPATARPAAVRAGPRARCARASTPARPIACARPTR